MTTTATRPTPAPLTIHIAEDAVDHVRQFAKQAGNPEGSLRVAVKGGGCSGLTYSLDLVDEPREDDKIVEEHGGVIVAENRQEGGMRFVIRLPADRGEDRTG